jgi:hypothetical protein
MRMFIACDAIQLDKVNWEFMCMPFSLGKVGAVLCPTDEALACLRS